MKKAFITALLMALVSTAGQLRAQYATPPPAPNGQMLDGSQLDQMLGPIALYPDPLIAEILPAATQPSQIALAYNYVSSGGDQNAIDQQPWDGSVKALARYPDVLKMLGDNLPWTAELGQAFLNQPSDVMDSVQRLRAQAQNLGNLETTPQETVVSDDGEIEIVPADPELIYVPVYDPGIIFYQRPYGRHFLTFGVGFHVGLWLNHDFDWHDHHVVVWGHDHPRPANWWHEPVGRRREDIAKNNVWRPGARSPGRPVVVNRGDRGYAPAPRDNHPASPRDVRAPAPRQEVRPAEPVRQVRPAAPVRAPEPPREVRPAAPVQTRPAEPIRQPAPAPRPMPAPAPAPRPAPAAPARPSGGMSAFGGGSSSQTREASSRGAVSRGGGGGGGGGGGARSGGKR